MNHEVRKAIKLFFQARVYEWASKGNETESVKNYLRGHEKTGPFLEDGVDDSVVKVKRLSGLRSKSKQNMTPNQVTKKHDSL